MVWVYEIFANVIMLQYINGFGDLVQRKVAWQKLMNAVYDLFFMGGGCPRLIPSCPFKAPWCFIYQTIGFGCKSSSALSW